MEALLIVGGVLLLLAVILGPLAVIVRRRSRRIKDELAALLATEPAVMGPERGLYRGGSGPYPKVKGNGTLVLTRRRLLFKIMIGTGVDIPVEQIVGLRTAKSFEGARTGGHVHLIVQTPRGEVGFFVHDNAAWITAITGMQATAHH